MTTDNKLNAATKWWNKLSPLERGVLRDMNNISSSATDSEILSIWKKETKPDNSPSVLVEPGDLDKRWSRWDLYIMLYNLTPGGSEYALDPQACFDYAKKELRDNFKTVHSLQKENEQLKARLTEC